MPKLYEVLAVENTLHQAAKKLMDESVRSLGKENLFNGMTTKLNMFDAEQAHLNTTETVELVTTVDENLDYIINPIAQYWDAVLQKDASNQNARADIIIDGTVLAADVPATFLLGLESKLGDIRKLYEKIHTLAPGFKWVLDEQERPGTYKTTAPVRFKTEKDTEFRIVVAADEHHPAQVRELPRTQNVARYDTTKICGFLTPLEKAVRIKRIDTLLRAVKKARQRANSVDLTNAHIGEYLFAYINSGG